MTQGTTPPGARTEEEAARWVRSMFADVAPRYDLLNRVLSLQIDQRWRAHTVRRVRSYLEDPAARILDLCCGTGDLLLALEKVRQGPVLGSDFCHPMLTASQAKRSSSPLSRRLQFLQPPDPPADRCAHQRASRRVHLSAGIGSQVSRSRGPRRRFQFRRVLRRHLRSPHVRHRRSTPCS